MDQDDTQNILVLFEWQKHYWAEIEKKFDVEIITLFRSENHCKNPVALKLTFGPVELPLPVKDNSRSQISTHTKWKNITHGVPKDIFLVIEIQYVSE